MPVCGRMQSSRFFNRRVIQLAVRWMLDQGISVALWGGRHPGQLEAVRGVAGWSLDATMRAKIDRILNETITEPVGPEFMAPAPRPDGPGFKEFLQS
jgi:aryl-alcohol dehydrogenase-like predicted oxidoreductase